MKNKVMLAFFPLFLVLYEMSTYLSNDMYLPAMPLLRLHFHASQHMIQYTLIAWFLGSASLQLILGPLSDRFGRRPILLIGGAFFVAANLIAALTQSFLIFLLARFFQGAAVCSVVVAGYAAIHELYDHIKAIRTLALMNSFTIVAPAFGPLLGVFVLIYTKWQFIFVVLGCWAFSMIIFLYFIMPETNANGRELHPINFRKIISDYFLIICNRIFIINTLSFCLLFAGLVAWVAAGAFLVISNLHHSAIYFGFIQLVVFSGFVIAAQLVRILIMIYGVNKVILIGYGLIGLSCSLMLMLIICHQLSLLMFVFTLIIYASAVGMLFSTVQRVAVESCTQPMGRIIAIFFTGIGLFCIIGSLLVSLYFTNTLSSLSLIIIIFGLSSLLIRYFLRTKNVLFYNVKVN